MPRQEAPGREETPGALEQDSDEDRFERLKRARRRARGEDES